MKKLTIYLILALISVFHSSYDDKKGGDMFQIFYNGKQVHQQFVHASKELKTLQLSMLNEKDQLEVLYSHCGESGKSRSIVFRNEKNEVIQLFNFPDTPNTRMTVSGKAFGKIQNKKMFLYYRSKELPTEKLLAVIQWLDEVRVTKK